MNAPAALPPHLAKPALPPAVGSVLSDRYAILGELASGGMASVLYGRLKGPVGFARAVAIKRLHPHIAREPEFVSMFIDEARICARLSHVNIVPTLDVIEVPSELCLVMEYVHGASLDVLLDVARKRQQPVPVRIAVGLMVGVLHGLHAAHEARDDQGESLCIVHRDVSPQNVLLGEDGVARVLDFGIAKAVGKLRTTPSGEVKGKLAYMAPEQFRGGTVDRRVDVHGAGAVLWEALVGRPLFEGDNESAIVYRVLNEVLVPPSSERPDLPPELDTIVMRALAGDSTDRFESAREMALCLERQVGGASQSEVSEWVRELIGAFLDARAAELRRLSAGQESEPVRSGARDEEGNPAGTRRITPAATKVASIASTQASPARSRHRAWVLTLLGVGLLVALGAFALRGRQAAVVHTAPRVEPQAVPAPSVIGQPTPSPVEAALEPTNSQVDAAVVQVDEVDEQAERVARRRKARAARAGELSPGDNSADKAQCSPPYWWSSDGVKHYKRECL